MSVRLARAEMCLPFKGDCRDVSEDGGQVALASSDAIEKRPHPLVIGVLR
jgi:hypothetical protein